MGWIFTLSAVVLVTFGLPLALLVRALRRGDLQIGSRLRTPPEQIPDATRAALDAEVRELAALGFELCCYERVQPFVRARCIDIWGVTLWNEAWRSFAVVSTTAVPSALRPLHLCFWSLLRDGSRLLTTNGDGWSMVGDDGRTEAHDAYVHTLAAHSEAHFARLRALPAARHPVRATPAQLADFSRDDAGARIGGMAAAGDLVETGDGAWRFTVRGALRWARIFRSRAAPYQKWLAEGKRRAKESGPQGASPELLADAFYRNRELEETRRSSGAVAKACLLVGTLALFALSFAGGFDARGLAVLTGVLFFHELGHWAGMRAFGYRDTSIFFIPFLGAATSGRNPDATATQRMLVYLLGPVPGLLLAAVLLFGADSDPIAALWAAEPELVNQTASMLLLINFFNLLPILPFDGGHIARLLLFGRHPWSEVVFRVLALGGLFGLGVLLHAPLLGVVAGVSALALPQALRVAKLGRELAKLRRAGVWPAERSLVERAFAWIESTSFRQQPFPQKYALVRDALLGESTPAPGFAATLCFGLLYLVCLAIGPATAMAGALFTSLYE